MTARIALVCTISLTLALLCSGQSCSLSQPDQAGVQVHTLSQTEINGIIQVHDYWKVNTPSPMKDMQPYVWDTTLAGVALQWARKCLWQHTDQCFRTNIGSWYYVGENLASGSDPAYSPANNGTVQMCQNWASELSYYSWSTNGCQGGQMCGHYTQMVWSTSTNVGCAMVQCPANTILGSFVAWYLVCEYGPGGNIGTEFPATVAPSGSPCYSKPCGPNGICTQSSSGTSYTCACFPGYSNTSPTGKCNAASSPASPGTNACSSNPCGSFGTCALSGTTFKCTCTSGYTGTTCTTPTSTNPCSSNPCVHGTCTPSGSTYSCACQSGYIGTTCSVVSPCNSNPCANGGTCTVSGTSYTCKCATGWSGTTCTTATSSGSTTPPATTTFVGALWAQFNSNRQSMGLKTMTWSSSQAATATNDGNKCNFQFANSESYLEMCNTVTTLDPSWASALLSWWAYDPWWHLSGVTSAGCGVAQCSPSSSGSQCAGYTYSLPVVCMYTLTSSTTAPVSRMMGFQKSVSTQLLKPKHNFALYAVAGVCAVFVVSAVALVVLRRRRLAAAQVETEIEIPLNM